MESCGNYHFQIRKVAGVADDSLDSLLVNGIGFVKPKPACVPSTEESVKPGPPHLCPDPSSVSPPSHLETTTSY